MFIFAVFIIIVLMVRLYISENRLASLIFTAVSAGFIINVWKDTGSRKNIWDYLVQHSYDMIPSYKHIEYYDKAVVYFCGFALAVAVISVSVFYFGNRYIDIVSDIVVFLVMVTMGAGYIAAVFISISSYYDTSVLFTSAAVKGELILLSSYTIKSIIKSIKKAPV